MTDSSTIRDDPGDMEPFEPAYDSWTPCEDRTPDEIAEQEGEGSASLMLTGLDVALRNGRIPYWESPGWRQRGHGPLRSIRGILIHHTAGGGPNDWKVVQNGRPGLPGPLAQLVFERNGSVRIIAAGHCWHAGNGTHPGVGGAVGNANLIGIEGVSRGVGGDWTAAQRRDYPRVAAALCRHYRLPTSAVVGHKEYATPRGRKIDPGDWDMNDFRNEVARHLRGGPTEEDDMTPEQDRMLREIHQQTFRAYDFRAHHGNVEDNEFGQTLSVRKELTWLREQVNRIEAALPKDPKRA